MKGYTTSCVTTIIPTDVLETWMKKIPSCIGRYIFQYIVGDADNLQFERLHDSEYEMATNLFTRGGWAFCRRFKEEEGLLFYKCRYETRMVCDACCSPNCRSDYCGAMTMEDHHLVVVPLVLENGHSSFGTPVVGTDGPMERAMLEFYLCLRSKNKPFSIAFL